MHKVVLNLMNSLLNICLCFPSVKTHFHRCHRNEIVVLIVGSIVIAHWKMMLALICGNKVHIVVLGCIRRRMYGFFSGHCDIVRGRLVVVWGLLVELGELRGWIKGLLAILDDCIVIIDVYVVCRISNVVINWNHFTSLNFWSYMSSFINRIESTILFISLWFLLLMQSYPCKSIMSYRLYLR